MNTIEVNFDSGQELKKGLIQHRNKFCDVRLWAENHAVPAHKLILSLHSTFFEELFASDSSASEVYLTNVRYIVLYPVIEFMYTGHVHINSIDVFEEIKTFSQTIKFRPFSSFWNSIPAEPSLRPPPTGMSIPTSISFQPSSISHERSNIPSTQVPNAAQASFDFVPTLTSTPVPIRDIPLNMPHSMPSPIDDRLLDLAILSDSAQVSPMPPRPNMVPVPMALNIVQQTPPRSLQPSSRKFRGFSPTASTHHRFNYICSPLNSSLPLDGHHNDKSIDSLDNNPSIVTFDSTPSILELSEISDASPTQIRKRFKVVDINENDVEILAEIPQKPITVLSGNEIPASVPKAVNEKETKPQARRGRPKKVDRKDAPEDKIYVSPALFKKSFKNPRGEKRKAKR